MATPSRDAIQTYMAITGASESLALQKLEEYGGNLNEAVNAHFGGGDINPTSSSPRYDSFNMNNQSHLGQGGLLPMLSAVRSFKPSLLLDPNYRRGLFNQIGAFGFPARAPVLSQPGEVTGIPVGFNSRDEALHHSGSRPNIEDVTGTSMPHSQGIHRDAGVAELNRSHAYASDVEEEMIQAAIKASTEEAEKDYLNKQFSDSMELSDNGLPKRQFHQEDEDYAQAVSLSLKTAEQEEALREKQVKYFNEELGIDGRWKPGSLSHKNGAGNAEQQHELRHEPNCSAGSREAYHFDEWGGISSKELDEAVMLESALFHENSQGASHSGPDRISGPNHQHVHHPQSPSLAARQMLREQQDKEYLASLLLDKDKERSAYCEAETHHSKEESKSTLLDEVCPQEYERRLAAKKASLPCEPASDDENAVNILVRMPNGSRIGRRFLKSDKLQLVFDFIDVGSSVKTGTYRVARSYPRYSFGVDDSLSTLGELGLTNKQEALFLELI
ncbi:plant UBX domain-containing protein 8 isoform X2 [Ziziphus jujuba]|uniref:Plant UBX domain-containing protein 8 isoform X2 n=1 Tax=Ziziphus jujuba TaxID=326968 RepID=A0ABM3IPI9_ZIZJJ|nr:plant UBX domain-containing protein 8 isoform X2 [Ziziphus jujuba]